MGRVGKADISPRSEREKEADADGTQPSLPTISELPPRGGMDPPFGNKELGNNLWGVNLLLRTV